jgi:hypothetical protein
MSIEQEPRCAGMRPAVIAAGCRQREPYCGDIGREAAA